MATHTRNFDSLAHSTSHGSDRVLDTLTTTVARGAFALPFAVFGLFHFLNASAMAGAVPVPGGVFWIYATGLALVAGSLGILTGKLGRLAALGLAALMLTFILGVHIPGLGNAATQQMAIMGLLKDVALLGGALTWAGLLKERSYSSASETSYEPRSGERSS